MIVLDVRLTRRERRWVLAHELIHDESGIGYTSATPRLLVEMEERCVRVETVRRLVPSAELAALVTRPAPEPVLVIDVADEFDVDHRTARHACAQLG